MRGPTDSKRRSAAVSERTSQYWARRSQMALRSALSLVSAKARHASALERNAVGLGSAGQSGMRAPYTPANDALRQRWQSSGRAVGS